MKRLAYLQFFNELIIKQDYFECHEIMEAYWKTKEARTKHDLEVMMIQVSTAEYHYRRGNTLGAIKSYRKSLSMLCKHNYSDELFDIGVNAPLLKHYLTKRLNAVLSDKIFTPSVLPVSTSVLMNLKELHANDMTLEAFITFISSIHVTDEWIIHKHRLRDREHVIAARRDALKKKQLGRQNDT